MLSGLAVAIVIMGATMALAVAPSKRLDSIEKSDTFHAKCSDSDKGAGSQRKAGYVEKGFLRYNDFCSSGTVVREYRCRGNDVKKVRVPCRADETCLVDNNQRAYCGTVTCTDTDPDNDIQLKGSVKWTLEDDTSDPYFGITDSCVYTENSTTSTVVEEVNCSDKPSEVTKQIVPCPRTYTCSNGACIPPK